MLQVGDEIVRYSNYGVIDCVKVERVTPTQAILTLKDRAFHKTVKLKREPNTNGIITEISADRFNGNRYRLPKDGDIEDVKFKIAIRICSECDFDKLDRKKVFEIASIISSTAQ